MSILLDGVRCSFDPTQEEQWEKVFQKLPKVVLERLLGTGHGLSVLTMGMEGVQPQERASLMRLTWLTDEQVAQVQDELLYREIRDNRGLQVLDCDDQEDGLIPERGQTIFFSSRGLQTPKKLEARLSWLVARASRRMKRQFPHTERVLSGKTKKEYISLECLGEEKTMEVVLQGRHVDTVGLYYETKARGIWPIVMEILFFVEGFFSVPWKGEESAQKVEEVVCDLRLVEEKMTREEGAALVRLETELCQTAEEGLKRGKQRMGRICQKFEEGKFGVSPMVLSSPARRHLSDLAYEYGPHLPSKRAQNLYFLSLAPSIRGEFTERINAKMEKRDRELSPLWEKIVRGEVMLPKVPVFFVNGKFPHRFIYSTSQVQEVVEELLLVLWQTSWGDVASLIASFVEREMMSLDNVEVVSKRDGLREEALFSATISTVAWSIAREKTVGSHPILLYQGGTPIVSDVDTTKWSLMIAVPNQSRKWRIRIAEEIPSWTCEVQQVRSIPFYQVKGRRSVKIPQVEFVPQDDVVVWCFPINRLPAGLYWIMIGDEETGKWSTRPIMVSQTCELQEALLKLTSVSYVPLKRLRGTTVPQEVQRRLNPCIQSVHYGDDEGFEVQGRFFSELILQKWLLGPSEVLSVWHVDKSLFPRDLAGVLLN